MNKLKLAGQFHTQGLLAAGQVTVDLSRIPARTRNSVVNALRTGLVIGGWSSKTMRICDSLIESTGVRLAYMRRGEWPMFMHYGNPRFREIQAYITGRHRIEDAAAPEGNKWRARADLQGMRMPQSMAKMSDKELYALFAPMVAPLPPREQAAVDDLIDAVQSGRRFTISLIQE